MSERIVLSTKTLSTPIDKLVDPEYKQAFEDKVAISRGQVAFWAAAISGPLWATGYILDWIVYPEFYPDLFLIRTLSIVALIFAAFLFPPNKTRNSPIITLYLSMFICSLALSVSIATTGEQKSPYLVCYMLFACGSSVVLNLKPREAITGYLLISSTFLIPVYYNNIPVDYVIGTLMHALYITIWTFFASRVMTALLYNNLVSELELAKIGKEKDEFLSNVSHEFRTPITLIVSPIDSIRANLEDHKSVDRYLSVAKSEGLRLLRQVNNMLDYLAILNKGGAKGVISLVRSDVSKVIESNLVSFELLAKQKNLSFSVNDIAGHPLIGMFDIREIDKVFSNLLMNSIKFTREGGIEVTLRIENGFLVFTVADSGIGINKDEIDKLFIRLNTGVKSEKTGWGLGLYLAKKIVEGHSGTITMNPRPIKGTVVEVKLPLTEIAITTTVGSEFFPVNSENSLFDGNANPDTQANRTLIVDQIDSSPHLDNRIAIMVVDDEINMRRFIKDIFSENFTVFTANNAEHALSIATNNRVDAAIIDFMLPDLNGLVLAERLRALTPTTKLIMLTASKDRTIETQAATLLDDFYVKPFDRTVLKKRVANLLGVDVTMPLEYGSNNNEISALVIEDNKDLAKLISNCFQKDIDVSLAYTVENARSLLSDGHRDIIILDIELNGQNGLDLAKELKSKPHLVDTSFIVVSGNTSINAKIASLEVCDDFILKPFDHRELELRLRNHVREHQLKRDLRDKNNRLEENNSKLIQQEKLAAIGELSMTFTHEVRNSLNYTTSAFEFLKLADIDLLTKEDLMEILNDVKTGIDQIDAVTNTLRVFRQAKTERDFRAVNLEVVLANSIKFSTFKNQDVSVQVICPALVVWGSETQLIQVFSNLISNSISAFSEAQKDKVIIINCTENHENITIIFSDNGPGISIDDSLRLFDKFYTTNKSGSSTGMGLSISRVIINSHEGEIRFIGNDPGAVFEITLPKQASIRSDSNN